MNLETIYRKHLLATDNPIAAAILTQTEAMLGMQPQKALTPKQAAERLGVSVDSVYDLCRNGKLRHKKFGRSIRIEQVDLANYQGDIDSGQMGFRCLKVA